MEEDAFLLKKYDSCSSILQFKSEKAQSMFDVYDYSRVHMMKKPNTGLKIGLLYATIAAYALHISSGAIIAWPSLMIRNMKLTYSQNSLLNSLPSVGMVFGLILAGLCLETIGRRTTLLLSALAFTVSWVPLLFRAEISAIYTSRILGGIGLGIALPSVSLYVAEIADDNLRGPLNTLMQPFMALGYLVQYAGGPPVSFETIAWISLSMPLLNALMLCFVPESPHFLVNKCKVQEARVALLYLRGSGVTPEAIDTEILAIQDALEEVRAVSYSHPWTSLFTTVAGRRCLLIGVFLQTVVFTSAINSVVGYVQYVFDLARIPVSTLVVTVLISLINIVASLPLPILVKLLGYKILFFISAAGSGLSMIMMGLYFYLLQRDYDTFQLAFIPILGIIFYHGFCCLAIGPLPWSVFVGMCAPSVKGVALAINGLIASLLSFLSNGIFSITLQYYGLDTVFWGFGIIALIEGLLCLLIVPDTSRMSLRKIQDYLAS